MLKVFISYYHKDDQSKKDFFLIHNRMNQIFIDNSVSLGDINDEFLTDEQIRRIIRDDYIKDSDVFILLCGKNTRHRKHIDWELHAAMYKSDIKDPLPIIVINIDDHNNYTRIGQDEIFQYFPQLSFYSYPNSAYNAYLSKNDENILPERVLSSIKNKKCPISVIPISLVYNYWSNFGEFIKKVYENRRKFIYDDSSLLRRRNGDDTWF